MGFFDSLYRLFGENDEWNPEGMAQVDLDPQEESSMGPPTPRGVQPRMIPPTTRSYNRPGFDTYLEHIRSMPREEEYEPGLGRKIAAGLIGFSAGLKDPAAGYAASEKIIRSPYERALNEWKMKSTELGTLAEEEGKYIGNISDENVEGGRLGARYAELDAKLDQINKNYEVASKNATTAEARVAAQKARDQALAEIARERNEIDEFEAQTGRQRAGDYGRYVTAYGENARSGGVPKPSDVNDMYNAEQDALIELMSADPAFQKFYRYDETTQSVIPIMPGEEGWSPEDLAMRDALQSKVGIETQKRLGGLAAGGAPPLWRMRPNVVIPPERRRVR